MRVKVGDKVSQGSMVLVLEPAVGKSATEEKPQRPPRPRQLSRRSAETRPSPAQSQQTKPASAPAPQRATSRIVLSRPLRPGARHDEEAFGNTHASRACGASRANSASICRKSKASAPKTASSKRRAGLRQRRACSTARSPTADWGFNCRPCSRSIFKVRSDRDAARSRASRKLSGAFLHRKLGQHSSRYAARRSDITELECVSKIAGRGGQGAGHTSRCRFLVKAAVVALKQYPEFNASLSPDGESLIVKNYYHIVVAVEKPNGLVVPVNTRRRQERPAGARARARRGERAHAQREDRPADCREDASHLEPRLASAARFHSRSSTRRKSR